MNTFKKKKIKKGTTIIEVVLAIAIASILAVGFFRFYVAYQNFEANKRKEERIRQVALAIQLTAKEIINTFSSVCTNLANAQDNLGWGWRSPQCSNTIIFPTLNNNVLTYNLNLSNLSQTEQNKLLNTIASYFQPCSVTVGTNAITITCPDIDRIYYCRSEVSQCNNLANLVTSVHTPGQSYNYITNKISALVIEWTEVSIHGSQGIQHRIGETGPLAPLIIDFTSFNEEMYALNYRKFVDIYNALKRYEVTRRVDEMKNTAPAGLPELDDYFVPWVWQITASNVANAYLNCNRVDSGNTCANFDLNVWRTNISSTDMRTFMQNIINYLLAGNRNYVIDAWGNPIGIELLIRVSDMSCTRLYSPSHGDTCKRFLNPPIPQTNYNITEKPPFIGYIYSEFCWDLSNLAQNACRMPIVYAN